MIRRKIVETVAPRPRKMMRKVLKTRSLTTTQKAEVKALVASQEETKYSASQIVTGAVVPIDFVANPIGMLVPIAQGATSNRRIGDRITPTRMTTKFHFYFEPAFNTTVDVTVCLYILTNKTFKSTASVISDPRRQLILDYGNGVGGAAWDPANPIISEMCRMDPESVTVLKKKQFRLIRNVGTDDLDVTPGNAPNLKQSVARYTYTHKRLPKLKYDGGATDANNYAPYFYVVAYRTDGAGPLPNTLQPNFHARSELYFKDA